MNTIVLGLGNLIHCDDGAGVQAIQRLETDARVPGGVVLLDGGTHGLNLLPHLSGCERLLVIDAVDTGEKPGTVVRLEGDALANMPGKASVHQLGFSDLMVAMQLLGDPPGEVVVLGVQPLSTEWSVQLSPPVEHAMEVLLDAAVAQLNVWTEASTEASTEPGQLTNSKGAL